MGDRENSALFENEDKPLAKIAEELIRRAGLSTDLISGGDPRPSFDAVLIAMSKIRRGKEALYGSFIENKKGDSVNFALIGHFVDMRRKWARANTFIQGKFEEDKDFEIEELLDTYIDLAVYAALGVQLIEAIRKGEVG